MQAPGAPQGGESVSASRLALVPGSQASTTVTAATTVAAPPPASHNATRTIYVHDPIRNAPFKYLHNRIATAKYNVISFLPRFLFEQFGKYANIFFALTSAIQQINGVSPTSQYTTLGPLGFVLFITAIKEIMEDWKRHTSDAEVNARLVKVLSGTQFVEQPWRQVRVGDIVRVENGQPFPADLILLSSSEPDAICYIETANLDGETNLKIRQGLPETALILTPEQLVESEMVVTSELPNNSLYTFEGVLQFQGKSLALDPLQVCLRGAQLRNTRWIYGIVIFTGHDSKLMRNSSTAPIKRTNVEKMTNTQIIFLFVILILMSLASTIGNYFYVRDTSHWYLYLTSNDVTFGNSVLQFLTFLVLYNNLIPISLVVTMETVRFFQSLLINYDLDMYYAPSDTPAQARTSTLVEELGQIEYIFSDKTGTLTCNIMELKQCLIAGRTFVDKLGEGQQRAHPSVVNDQGYEVGAYEFHQIQDLLQSHSQAKYMDEFFTLLAVCHTVIPETNDDDPSIITYQAASPDEGALVNGAASIGYKFLIRRPRSVTIDVFGHSYEYEIMNVLEFNSTRKRMSVIARRPDGRIVLFTKGADTVILERLSKENIFVDATLVQLEDCATEGLRTLCLAMRTIPQEEYDQWSVIYNKASTTINNRSQELDKAAELIEKELFLIGATAIEDKLQEGVPETIHILAEANIKIWVLTGDRQETAINIGYSCKLLTEEMTLIVVNEATLNETQQFLASRLAAITGQSTLTESGIIRNKETGGPLESEIFALIIDGSTLKFALDKKMEKLFFQVASLCKAVICCRVSPLQKALVVKLVKNNTSAILLAIGDGANDVSMIQAAHVGVGISGQEGLQAARSADFAISQFRYLRKLLLVHGGWSYRRLSTLILYSFYKNIIMNLTQFLFAFFNRFSGQTLYESWIYSFYNVLFTSLPPLIIGIFDQYVNARLLDSYPQLYTVGHSNVFFNKRVFWMWSLDAAVHSAALFVSWYYLSNEDLIYDSTGRLGGLWYGSTLIYSSVLGTAIGKSALITQYWTKWAFIFIIGSFVIWFVFLPVYIAVGPFFQVADELYGLVPPLFGSAVFWFSLLLIPIMCLFRNFGWKFYNRQFYPKSYHIVQEFQKFNIPDYRPRMDRFRKAVHKVRLIQRLKRNRGFAFSQSEGGQESLIRRYDTTKAKPKG